MRGALAAAAAAAVLAAAAPATHGAGARVLVVDRAGEVIAGPAKVAFAKRTLRVGKRRCAVGPRTPLSVLAGTRLALALRDYGSCSRRPRDAGALYVRAIEGERARGRQGWVYKVGRKVGSAGGADPAGPFGSGPLRAGARVTWFWCRPDPNGRCQRTLETAHERQGEHVRVTVTGYDDRGRGVAVAGAEVRLGDATATTDAAGVATLSGAGRLTARAVGMVPAFPVKVP